MNYKGIDYLRKKLDQKRTRVAVRYKYYEMKNTVQDFSPLIPEGFKGIKEVSGWCAKAVDTLADRVVFDTQTDRCGGR